MRRHFFQSSSDITRTHKTSLFKYIEKGDLEAIRHFLNKNINENKIFVKKTLESLNENNETVLHLSARLLLESENHMESFFILMNAAKDVQFDFTIYPNIQGKKRLIDDVLSETMNQFLEDSRKYAITYPSDVEMEQKIRRVMIFENQIDIYKMELRAHTIKAMDKLVQTYEERTKMAVELIEGFFIIDFQKELNKDLNTILRSVETTGMYSLSIAKKLEIYKGIVSNIVKSHECETDSITSEVYSAIIDFVPEDEDSLSRLDTALLGLSKKYQEPKISNNFSFRRN